MPHVIRVGVNGGCTFKRKSPNMDAFEFFQEVKKIKVVPQPWMTSGEYTFNLVTKETLPALVDACIAAGRYSLDLEATGLDLRVYNGETNSKIVGFCLSPNGKDGYYAPVRHKDSEHNIPWTFAKSEILRLIRSSAKAIFHNGKFDQELLQFCGGEPLGEWDNPKTWEDTLILAYLRNSRAKQKGLKFLSETELGMKMIELEELFPPKTKDLDFSTLDPSDQSVLWYACSDGICTFKLFDVLYEPVVNPNDGIMGQGSIYTIEKGCVAATRWMERPLIQVDVPKTKELIRLGLREWMESLEELYSSSSEILGRDIRPSFHRGLRGDLPKYPHLRFNADVELPNYMERVETAREICDRNNLDPVDANGKIRTVTKRVPGLKPQPTREVPAPKAGPPEDVAFPLVYDVMSPAQLGMLLRELQVPGLMATPSGKGVATSADEIDRVLEESGDRFPFTAKIKRFREIAKALSTYLYPLIEDCDDKARVRANFNGFRVDTGRFSAPSSKEPSRDGGTRFPFHGTPATYDPKRPQCLARVRECIVSREPGWFITSIDLSGEELRIVTNLSGEPKWLKEFFRCSGCGHEFDRGDGKTTPEPPPPFCPKCGSDKIGDVHTITALAFFGDNAINLPNWKDLRQKGKISNFALAYGGGGNAVCAATGCDKEEGYRYKQRFDETYTALLEWWQETIQFAREHGFIVTSFGRRYPLPDINSEFKGFKAKAERNACNGPVQCLAGDFIKLAMFLVYNEVKKRGWFDKVKMLLTMHDELVFEIHGSILEEAIGVIKDVMCKNKMILGQNWPVPFTSDVEIGFDWTVPWNLEKIRHKGKWPDELKPYFKEALTASPKEESKKAPATPKGELRVYSLKSYTLGVVEEFSEYILSGGFPDKVIDVDGNDITSIIRTSLGL
jgi:DNA polymerase I-like protein with 3'-5' exonuclease and polymerase domains